MGLTAITLFLAATTAARNLRIADAFTARATQNARRAAMGNSPRSRRRSRKTITNLANAPPDRTPPHGSPLGPFSPTRPDLHPTTPSPQRHTQM